MSTFSDGETYDRFDRTIPSPAPRTWVGPVKGGGFGFPFRIVEQDKYGDPIEEWDRATFFQEFAGFGVPSKSSSEFIPVVGRGTGSYISFSKEELALLFWRGKKFKIELLSPSSISVSIPSITSSGGGHYEGDPLVWTTDASQTVSLGSVSLSDFFSSSDPEGVVRSSSHILRTFQNRTVVPSPFYGAVPSPETGVAYPGNENEMVVPGWGKAFGRIEVKTTAATDLDETDKYENPVLAWFRINQLSQIKTSEFAGNQASGSGIIRGDIQCLLFGGSLFGGLDGDFTSVLKSGNKFWMSFGTIEFNGSFNNSRAENLENDPFFNEESNFGGFSLFASRFNYPGSSFAEEVRNVNVVFKVAGQTITKIVPLFGASTGAAIPAAIPNIEITCEEHYTHGVYDPTTGI